MIPGRLRAPLVLLCLLAGCGEAAPDAPVAATGSATAGKAAEARAQEPLPDLVRVKLETGAGPIVLALDAKRAPLTTANFVRYAEEGRLDGTSFYRAARTKGEAAGRGFIQGGIQRSYKRMLPPVEHEPTSQTGLKHEAGTISMAKPEDGKATGEFFIAVSPQAAMDSAPGKPGYAAFGKVVEGMDVVRKILAAPTIPNAGRGKMRGQMIEKPVAIVKAQRVE